VGTNYFNWKLMELVVGTYSTLVKQVVICNMEFSLTSRSHYNYTSDIKKIVPCNLI